MELIQKLWNPEDRRLLERLNKDVLSGINLAILDPSRRFYIKIDWSKYGMRAVILNDMPRRRQEIQRHNKRTVESLNLTSI